MHVLDIRHKASIPKVLTDTKESLTSVCPKFPTASNLKIPAFSLALSFFLLWTLYASLVSLLTGSGSGRSFGGAIVMVILEQEGSRSARASCSHVDYIIRQAKAGVQLFTYLDQMKKGVPS
jgi:hypothetical protein